MDWITLAIVAAVVATFVLLQRMRLVSPTQALALLKAGGRVIDVRSREEFAARSLPGATNVPLDELATRVAKVEPDKNAILLLHCLSGARSERARRELTQLGYAQVFNLGSFSRAERILRRAGS